ncbi:Endonuclease/exonuclease/phosphatase [Scleroderma citrinum]
MRILSWNINGVRTLPQYHPWNSFKTFQEILMHLQADIICFQEMKTSRSSLDRNIGTPDPFDGFFSFPANKGGYSGVAVYTNSQRLVPLKAEEGLSGTVQPKPPLNLDERISRSYPCVDEMKLTPDELGDTPSDLTSLDGEGRAIVLDLGLFVLINVYCPNETSDARLPFKMNYHFMLQERVNKLITEGREVVVVGDINVCATPLDHCDGHLASNATTFYDHPARAWFRDWIGPNGSMTDVLRTFWPGRKGMYTCWNTKICARETNYGTRVDYILATRGILPWIKHGDIQPSVKGSDHCPLYIDLHDEITTNAGVTLTLREVMPPPVDNEAAALPRIAARRWVEFSGQQTLLSTFFARGARVKVAQRGTSDSSASGSPSTSPPQASVISSISTEFTGAVPPDRAETLDLPNSSCDSGPSSTTSSKAKSPGIPKSGSQEQQHQVPQAPYTAPPKRKLTDVSTMRAKPIKKLRNAAAGSAAGKGTLDAFFTQSSSQSQSLSQLSQSQSQEYIITDDPLSSDADPCAASGSLASDYQLALGLSAISHCQDNESLAVSSGSKAAWSKLMTPVEPPKCNVHGEPAKLYTVNKPGPNKGKTFFLCSRPVGPGYDKGKGERPRDEVNHAYRCSFFKWAAEVKRESSARNDNDDDGDGGKNKNR